MNQILVSDKIYVTPQVKRKKKFLKLEFFLSIFLVCFLSSYYIYAEYDKNKAAQVSYELVENLGITQKEEEKLKSVVVVLNSAFSEEEQINIEENEEIAEIPSVQIATAKDGTEYYTIGEINIPKIGVNFVILSETTTELLKTSPCKFWGPDPNREGNLCIVGHNYRDSRFFGKVPTLEYGDIIEITDLSGKTLEYSVYDKYTVEPDDMSCIDQETNGRKEITLITCTNDGKQRVIVKAVAQKD